MERLTAEQARQLSADKNLKVEHALDEIYKQIKEVASIEGRHSVDVLAILRTDFSVQVLDGVRQALEKNGYQVYSTIGTTLFGDDDFEFIVSWEPKK
jgi:hypothetical protein